jgi:hypothetical protein
MENERNGDRRHCPLILGGRPHLRPCSLFWHHRRNSRRGTNRFYKLLQYTLLFWVVFLYSLFRVLKRVSAYHSPVCSRQCSFVVSRFAGVSRSIRKSGRLSSAEHNIDHHGVRKLLVPVRSCKYKRSDSVVFICVLLKQKG